MERKYWQLFLGKWGNRGSDAVKFFFFVFVFVFVFVLLNQGLIDVVVGHMYVKKVG